MMIVRTEEHRLNLELGCKAPLCPRLRCLNVVCGGVLGRPEGELCSIIISELTGQLESREFDAAVSRLAHGQLCRKDSLR